MQTMDAVKALDKGLVVLDIVREADRPIGVNEIAKIGDINITTAFRLLQTLKNRGWVYQDANDKYIVGHKISLVTEKNSFLMALKEIAYYTMARLSTSESQAMNLVIRQNEKCLILQQSRTDKIIDYVPPIGSILPIYASATGKVLLSELSDLLCESILAKTELKPLTKNTITQKYALLDELKKIRNQGFAVDIHESQEEGTCVAAPVRSRDGYAIAALSFSGFIGIINEAEVYYYFQHLKKATDEITRNLFQFTTSNIPEYLYK